MTSSRAIVFFGIVCAIVALCGSSVWAGAPPPPPDSLGIQSLGMGGQALGMGGAFTAIADDPNAPFWNPAGLSKIQKFMFQPPNYQVAIHEGAVPVVATVEGERATRSPVSVMADLRWDDIIGKIPSDSEALEDMLLAMGYGSVGFDAGSNIAVAGRGFAVFAQPVYRVGLDTRGLLYSDGEPVDGTAFASGISHENVGISFARPVKEGGNLGVTLRSVTSNRFFEAFDGDSGSLDSVYRDDNKRTGVAIDLGYLRDVPGNATFGVMVRNALEPNVDGTFANRQINVGYARNYMGGRWLFAGDLQNVFNHPEVHVGAKYNAGRGVYLCTGLCKNKFTFGIGGTIFGAKLQFAYAPAHNSNASIMSGSVYW